MTENKTTVARAQSAHKEQQARTRQRRVNAHHHIDQRIDPQRSAQIAAFLP